MEKKHKILKFFEIGPELVRHAHLKAQWSDLFEDLHRIKDVQGQPYVRKRSILLIASQLMEGAKSF